MLLQRLRYSLFRQVSIAPLVTIRILFGLLMVFSTARFMYLGWIEDHYVNPRFHFKYFGFEWIAPLSREGLYIVHILLLISALMVALGWFYRIATVVLFICFTYTELIDLTYYLNHYYFVSIISFLFILVPAHRNFSIDVWRSPTLYCDTVPWWCLSIFKFQIAIIYIYAGLFKMNYDWLILALPMKIWLPANDTIPLLGKLFSWKYTPHLFSWLGMIYDTTIVFWLILKRTRPYAYLTVIVFHVLVGILFQIGVFPIVMIAITLIFFSVEWHKRWQKRFVDLFRLKRLKHFSKTHTQPFLQSSNAQSAVLIFAVIFGLFQILFPWRFVFYPGNYFWTEQGYRFGWRVMLMEKAGTATFYVKDTKTGREGEVFNGDFLNPHQEKQMAMQPDMILQYAHFLGDYYAQRGVYQPAVRAVVYVTLNARPSRLFIDSNLNLMTVKDTWQHKKWILE